MGFFCCGKYRGCEMCDPARDKPDAGEAEQTAADAGGYIGFWDGLLRSNPKPKGR